MCGIIGYIGPRRAAPIVIKGLKRLEYRGYDSAGIAVREDGGIRWFKKKGTVDALISEMPRYTGTIGIGHTRWATHGEPSRENAHPHIDCSGSTAVVHNGIIDNYKELKEELMDREHRFLSQTDTEVIPHLIEEAKGSLVERVRAVTERLKGSYALAVMNSDEEVLVGARMDSPLILAVGDGEFFLASDVPAVLEHTDKVVYLQNGDVVEIDRKAYRIWDGEGDEVKREVVRVDLTLEDAEKGGYPHFMLKEIFEQPSTIHNSLLAFPVNGTPERAFLGEYEGVKIVACGTSYHAGLVGKYIVEELAKVPASVEMASEYRYSSPPMGNPLVVLVTQSGETADTVAAAREAKIRGRRTVGITNIMGSSITREVDHVIYTRAGIEIGVAATKTFTAQVLAFYLAAIQIGMARGTLHSGEVREIRQHLRTLPRLTQRILASADGIKKKAAMFKNCTDAFFIGRNINYPIALEGALKMKEISYIHAEGYPAGELKHGPLALITPDTPVVALVPRDRTYDKMIGNMGEVSARGAPVLALASESDREIEKYADEVIRIPDVTPLYTPILNGVVLQLLAYYTARDRGCEIDKPRNLAKSVTVE
ncbi:MAG: glutamine--fructose-6-phosphate transaminase (isomerizing) [Thermoplasmata archaeon]|nr:glutamine--fructose-6-phosphate transaminase (isomerizing) [Thermoplasmata archaeon]